MRISENSTSMIPCSECHIGQMQTNQVTYFTWLDEDLITVPDFPAWKCDICGHHEYDLQALNNLALLLCPVETMDTMDSFRIALCTVWTLDITLCGHYGQVKQLTLKQ